MSPARKCASISPLGRQGWCKDRFVQHCLPEVPKTPEEEKTLYLRGGKHLLDLTLTIFALVVLCPVLLCVALLVRYKLGAPVLFRQRRPGLHRQPFTLLKFRTMLDGRDAQGNLLPDEQRLTRFGR